MAEAGAVCLEDQGHGSSCVLEIGGCFEEELLLHRPEVDDGMRRAHQDEQAATEHAAYGVAIVTFRHLTGDLVLRRSRRGTGFDFWFGWGNGFLFRDSSRLEVSGIRRGDSRRVRSRLEARKKRVAKSSKSPLPAYVAVVEFSRPCLRIEKT